MSDFWDGFLSVFGFPIKKRSLSPPTSQEKAAHDKLQALLTSHNRDNASKNRWQQVNEAFEGDWRKVIGDLNKVLKK